MDSLVGYGIPFIFTPKSREEKIEEARQSGLIGNRGDHDFVGAKYGQEIVCRRCGSHNITVTAVTAPDEEKGVQITYYCNNCDYEGTRAAKVKTVTKDKVMKVDLIPDSLIGLEGYGSFLGQY